MEETISACEASKMELIDEKAVLANEREEHQEACSTFKEAIKTQLKMVEENVTQQYNQMLENKENLPLRYNDRMLRVLRRKKDRVQDFLGRFDEMDATTVCNHFQASINIAEDL